MVGPLIRIRVYHVHMGARSDRWGGGVGPFPSTHEVAASRSGLYDFRIKSFHTEEFCDIFLRGSFITRRVCGVKLDYTLEKLDDIVGKRRVGRDLDFFLNIFHSHNKSFLVMIIGTAMEI